MGITKKGRREYQREYYQKNKEKIKEYQRKYNAIRTRKSEKAIFATYREIVRSIYNIKDIQHSPTEKSIKMLEKILKGERQFVN